LEASGVSPDDGVAAELPGVTAAGEAGGVAEDTGNPAMAKGSHAVSSRKTSGSKITAAMGFSLAANAADLVNLVGGSLAMEKM
jgi:hypothetical protein